MNGNINQLRTDLGKQIQAAGHSESGYVTVIESPRAWMSMDKKVYVSFNTAYTQTPSVILSITYTDINTDDENLRLDCKPKDVSLKGFNIHCKTWYKTKVEQFGVHWMAVADLS